MTAPQPNRGSCAARKIASRIPAIKRNVKPGNGEDVHRARFSKRRWKRRRSVPFASQASWPRAVLPVHPRPAIRARAWLVTMRGNGRRWAAWCSLKAVSSRSSNRLSTRNKFPVVAETRGNPAGLPPRCVRLGDDAGNLHLLPGEKFVRQLSRAWRPRFVRWPAASWCRRSIAVTLSRTSVRQDSTSSRT